MKLYTKTGDDGRTGLIAGQRVEKDHPRVACYGDVDELNATIGVAVTLAADDVWRDWLIAIQRDLFSLGTSLATPDGIRPQVQLDAGRADELEVAIDAVSGEMDALANFVLPGGCPLAAALHLARTVCRRAERSVVCLRRAAGVDAGAVIYLNRLGDLLFAMAVVANKRAGVENTLWTGGRD